MKESLLVDLATITKSVEFSLMFRFGSKLSVLLEARLVMEFSTALRGPEAGPMNLKKVVDKASFNVI
jgi:hypothetical protein